MACEMVAVIRPKNVTVTAHVSRRNRRPAWFRFSLRVRLGLLRADFDLHIVFPVEHPPFAPAVQDDPDDGTVGLLVSPTHAYFGRAREGAADVPTADAEQVQLVAGKGIAGDRFFGQAAHMDAAVTLIAVEALEAMAKELGVEPFNPLLIRRNVVLREARLAPLIGHDFALESSGDRQC
ncbi:MAG: hypothetical protein JWN19_488 [Arthrobacter sp.]|nr:hypothetical protein [Arthrobacter sp.]